MSNREYRCGWCGFTSLIGAAAYSCPACGASVDVRAIVDDGGWYELPPIRDIARLQIGRSTCQVEGTYVPIADFALAPNDRVYFNHGVMLRRDTDVRLDTAPLAGWFSRLMARLPMVLPQAHGPGRIAFSRDKPGEMIAIPLHPGEGVDVREGLFLAATGQVRYSWRVSEMWYRTGEGTHYPTGRFLDHFTAEGEPGLLLLHGEGNVFVRRLDGRQSILVKPPSLVYKDQSVRMSVYIEHPRGYNRIWSRRYVWLRLSGVGRVAIQSAFKHWEDPPEPVRTMASGGKVVDW